MSGPHPEWFGGDGPLPGAVPVGFYAHATVWPGGEIDVQVFPINGGGVAVLFIRSEIEDTTARGVDRRAAQLLAEHGWRVMDVWLPRGDGRRVAVARADPEGSG